MGYPQQDDCETAKPRILFEYMIRIFLGTLACLIVATFAAGVDFLRSIIPLSFYADRIVMFVVIVAHIANLTFAGRFLCKITVKFLNENNSDNLPQFPPAINLFGNP